MKIKGGYYTDSRGNKWNKHHFTKSQAEFWSDSLIGSYNCTNCVECTNCSNCDNCWDCNDCEDCENCYYCYECSKCSDVYYSARCLDCHKCSSCYNCEGEENRGEILWK